MRFAFLAVLCGAVVQAAPKTPVVAFLPPSSSDVQLQQLALLLEARASELVEETNKASEVHLKQTLRVISEEGLRGDVGEVANAEALRQAMGADRAVAFTLEKSAGDKLVLAGFAVDGKKPKTFSAQIPSAWSAALDAGSIALAKALLPGIALPKKTNAQPSSTNDEALKALGACYPVVMRQPLSVDTPAIVDQGELERAAASCQKASELDPKLRFAQAAGALALAISGGDAAATQSLAALGDPDDMLEIYTLARFWLLTRYQSNEAGVAFLTDVVKKHPGELVARSYLGETQFAIGAWKDAEKTFNDYLAIAPNSAWAWGRLSKALARQKRHEEAVVAAKKGFAVSPTSPEARLELGSRLIDAGKTQEAVEILEPLSRLTPARGEHLLRLGWAHWLQSEVDAAQAYFQRALDVATTAGEWRTRGRAHYDVALVEAKKGRKDAAKVALRASMQTGYKIKDLDPGLAPLARELERADIAADAGAGKPLPKNLLPREASLFPIDTYGEIDTTAKKPPPPNGLVLYRF
jgi:tetratricopeptide (TPR) repeat protein